MSKLPLKAAMNDLGSVDVGYCSVTVLARFGFVVQYKTRCATVDLATPFTNALDSVVSRTRRFAWYVGWWMSQSRMGKILWWDVV